VTTIGFIGAGRISGKVAEAAVNAGFDMGSAARRADSLADLVARLPAAAVLRARRRHLH
jgi:3-hydroxyisobutyrate dehydrogenase-like beta-hydroxyacid dehydrogenase